MHHVYSSTQKNMHKVAHNTHTCTTPHTHTQHTTKHQYIMCTAAQQSVHHGYSSTTVITSCAQQHNSQYIMCTTAQQSVQHVHNSTSQYSMCTAAQQSVQHAYSSTTVSTVCAQQQNSTHCTDPKRRSQHTVHTVAHTTHTHAACTMPRTALVHHVRPPPAGTPPQPHSSLLNSHMHIHHTSPGLPALWTTHEVAPPLPPVLAQLP